MVTSSSHCVSEAAEWTIVDFSLTVISGSQSFSPLRVTLSVPVNTMLLHLHELKNVVNFKQAMVEKNVRGKSSNTFVEKTPN